MNLLDFAPNGIRLPTITIAHYPDHTTAALHEGALIGLLYGSAEKDTRNIEFPPVAVEGEDAGAAVEKLIKNIRTRLELAYGWEAPEKVSITGYNVR